MSVERLCLAFLCASVFGYCLAATRNVNIDTRIVGGEEVDIKRCPYQVSIQYFNQHFCGGALISRDTVLSAAHCFGASIASVSTFYDVKVGSNTTSGEAIKIQSILVHPGYDPETIDNDISLIKLRSQVKLSDNVAFIRLTQNGNYILGSYASVSGWGYQKENGTVSPLLRKVDVPLTSRRQCEIDYARVINITRNMICAGFREGGRDACQGDSGGPLVQNYRLIGVVSFGMGCARKSYPGVYTNVVEYFDWVMINSNYSTNDTGFFNGSPRNYISGLFGIVTVIPVLLTIFLI